MPTSLSDVDLHSEIHSPSRANASSILASLTLSAVPRPDEIHQEIEECLLPGALAAYLPDVRIVSFLPYSTALTPHFTLPTSPCDSHWEEPLSLPTLLPVDPTPAPTRTKFVRTGLDERVTGFTEVYFRSQYSSTSRLTLNDRFEYQRPPQVSPQRPLPVSQVPHVRSSVVTLEIHLFYREGWVMLSSQVKWTG